ncbi:hypothetical protein C0584_06340 [Candidatus Parcubacteria bacterium]|nr:MAG: hypothetical protein C0584_06340 [Candidatus Parcubacteria bacterium]
MKKFILNLIIQPLIQSLFFYYFIFVYSGRTREFREFFIILPLVATYILIRVIINIFVNGKKSPLLPHKSFYFLFLPIAIISSFILMASILTNLTGTLLNLNVSTKVIYFSCFSLIILNSLIEYIYKLYFFNPNFYNKTIPERYVSTISNIFFAILPEANKDRILTLEHKENNKK